MAGNRKAVPMNANAELAGQKRLAATSAVDEVCDGMIVGLGTGTTAAFAIEALGRRVAAGLAIVTVATSRACAHAAALAGLLLRDLSGIAAIDLCIDGVDEIDPAFRAIKGAGGAMLREKIVATAARRMIAIADSSKAVSHIGTRPMPVEVLPDAHACVSAAIDALGGAATLRCGPDGTAASTDQGNIILDCRFSAGTDWIALAPELGAIPGMLGHGLFLTEIDALYLGTSDGLIRSERAIAKSPSSG